MSYLMEQKAQISSTSFPTLKNVAEPKVEGEDKASALIRYLCGTGFEFVYERFAKYE